MLVWAASAAAPSPAQDFVQAVEFPYYLYPSSLWERELVWLKNIGIRTVEFSIPWNWHQVQPGDFDLTGRTSPRRDLAGFVKLLRRLGMHAWVRPLAPVPDWPDGGTPANSAAQRAAWIRQIEALLTTQTASHGGPIEFVDSRSVAIDAGAPPEPVTVISATASGALAQSRRAIEKAHGTLLWTNVEDALYPAGWEPANASQLKKGVVGLSGNERPAVASVMRSAALLRHWPALLHTLRPQPARVQQNRIPDSLLITELTSPGGDALSLTNKSNAPFHDDLALHDPATRRTINVPGVTVPAGESLWLPVNVSLGPNGLCTECTNFSVTERLVYATAELLSIEYENGILALEFSAPSAGEAVLQLERKPVGPYLAGGKPIDFDWDQAEMRARLPVPASKAPGHRMRVGIAIEEPETSAFFNDAHRLIIGQKTVVKTSYSSPELAARSRLRLPEGFTANPVRKADEEIDYEIAVPADALHGDYANLAIEADGTPLGRARVQLFRPVSVRVMEAMQIHFGQETELTPEPAAAPIDPRSGGSVEISLRNNWPSIQTYKLEASGDGLTFFPAKTDVSIGAMEERRVSLRIFSENGVTGLRDWKLRVTGAGTAPVESAMRLVIIPRNRSVAWSADLDGDGAPEYILESSKVRAVFSAQDGGRWIEFTAKESNTNFLPEQGAFASPGPAAARIDGDSLILEGSGWRRTIHLEGGSLNVEQTTPLPADGLAAGKQNGIELSIDRPAPNRAIYKLE